MVFTRMTVFKVSPSYLESILGSLREIIGGMIEVSGSFLGILQRARDKWTNVNNLYIAVFCLIKMTYIRDRDSFSLRRSSELNNFGQISY